jgi:hypothetical protein
MLSLIKHGAVPFIQQSMDLSPKQIQVCLGTQCLTPDDDLAAAMDHM